MKTVIMAGGKGTRISSVANDIPKPMMRIEGKPVLEYEIECLRDQGFTDIIIVVGHLGKIIMDYFGDGSGISEASGKPFGVNIEYFEEKAPMGNAGALFKIKDKIGKEDFLLLNADIMFSIDINRMVEYHRQTGGLVTILTHPNAHPYDSSLIVAAADNSVSNYLGKDDERNGYYKNRVNAGIHIINTMLLYDIENIIINDSESAFGICKEMLSGINLNGEVNLDMDILKLLCGSGKLFAYDSPEYIKDMGTPMRYEAVCRDVERGIVFAKNLNKKQKAIFLDRDGTINIETGFLTDAAYMELLPEAAQAIKMINDSGYLVIVATNQSIIARGEATYSQLEQIHNKLETLLGNEGAYIDGLYFCPHHPHSGFAGEIKELKIECECRKPLPGMLIRASIDYNIDLSKSYMIGDRKTDIECGKNAGCKTVFIKGTEEETENGQDYTADSLYDAIKYILY